MMIYHLNSLLNTFATLLTAPIEATSTPDTADLPTDLISHAFRQLTNNLSCFATAKLQQLSQTTKYFYKKREPHIAARLSV